MELEKKYIYQVYVNGSFSKAAEALFVTQPALSIAVRKVEKEIGAALFHRGQRPITLTPVGEMYISYIKKEMLLEQEMKQQIDDLHGLMSGDICLGGTNYMNAYLLPPYITRFTRRFPHIHIRMEETSSDQLINLLKEHKLDFTFSCDESVIQEFENYESFSDHILLALPSHFALPEILLSKALSAGDVAAGRHLAKDAPQVELSDFPEIPFIAIDAHINLGARSLKIFEETGMNPKRYIEVPQLVTAYRLALAGIGASFLSDRLVDGTEQHIRFFTFRSRYAIRRYRLLLPHGSYTPAAVKEFIKLLKTSD